MQIYLYFHATFSFTGKIMECRIVTVFIHKTSMSANNFTMWTLFSIKAFKKIVYCPRNEPPKSLWSRNAIKARKAAQGQFFSKALFYCAFLHRQPNYKPNPGPLYALLLLCCVYAKFFHGFLAKVIFCSYRRSFIWIHSVSNFVQFCAA